MSVDPRIGFDFGGVIVRSKPGVTFSRHARPTGLPPHHNRFRLEREDEAPIRGELSAG